MAQPINKHSRDAEIFSPSETKSRVNRNESDQARQTATFRPQKLSNDTRFSKHHKKQKTVSII